MQARHGQMTNCNQLLSPERSMQLASVKESIDASSPAGRLTINILSSVAELEREQIFDKLQSARRCSKVWQGRKPAIHTKREAIKTTLNSETMSHQQIMYLLEFPVEVFIK